MSHIRNKIDLILSRILVVLMVLMVFNVLWQVASRFILGSPSSFTDELARYLMIWIGILGAAFVSGRNQHVSIDVFVNKLSESNHKKVNLLVNILNIVFCTSTLIIGGGRLVYITNVLGQHSPALQVPLSLVYSIIPISGLLIVIYKVMDLIKDYKWN